MKNFYGSLLVLALVVVSSFGCATRTKIVAGPVAVAGQVQVFEEPRPFALELGLHKVGVTLGNIECSVESRIGSCDKVIGLSHSTGETEQVLEDVPALGGVSE